MDFNLLDGYQFEELIEVLLSKMGFNVEKTSMSGDGGIDIIAYDSRPIFKGKYIVQCKNWNSSVGQPEVRDLYGVVMSEQANKGILITTSTFTQQAREFADNKNLELIDIKILVKLLNDYNIENIVIDKLNIDKIKFYDLNNFNKEKYNYLKEKINSNKSEKKYYERMKEFFHYYVINNEYEIYKNGLLDEYVELNNEMIRRFCKKSKIGRLTEKSLKYLNGYLYILKGEIFKAIEIFNDLDIFIPSDNIEFLEISNKIQVSLSTNLYDSEKVVWSEGFYVIYKDNSVSLNVIIKNLYLIFSYLNYENGMNYLVNLIEKNYEVLETSFAYKNNSYIIYNKEYFKRIELQMKDTIRVFEDIKNKKYNKFHIPINIEVNKDDLKSNYDSEVFIEINDIITTCLQKCNIQEELNKIDIIISSNILE